jgi:ATP-dependent Clp protease ATP-binding subunit ClpC
MTLSSSTSSSATTWSRLWIWRWQVIGRVSAKDIKIHLDTTAIEFLIDKGYDPTYGARPMRRAVEKYLEDPLAEEFLRGNIKQGDTLEVHALREQLAFKVTHSEQSKPANGSPLRSRG